MPKLAKTGVALICAASLLPTSAFARPITALPGMPPATGAPSATAFPPDTISTPRTVSPNTVRSPPTVNSAGPRVKRPTSGGKKAAYAIGGALLTAGVVVGVMQALKQGTPVEVAKKEPGDGVQEPTKVEPVVTPPVAGGPCPAGMVLIEGGRFFMGTDAGKSVLAMARPAHKVEVSRFCMDIYEVTTEDYVKCSDKGECKRAFPESYWPQGSMKKSEWEKARAAFSPLCNFGAEDRGRHPIN